MIIAIVIFRQKMKNATMSLASPLTGSISPGFPQGLIPAASAPKRTAPDHWWDAQPDQFRFGRKIKHPLPEGGEIDFPGIEQAADQDNFKGFILQIKLADDGFGALRQFLRVPTDDLLGNGVTPAAVRKIASASAEEGWMRCMASSSINFIHIIQFRLG